MEYLGDVVILLGVMAFLISAVGLVRMPDVYTRMHVGTKTTTIGTLLVLFGVILLEPTWTLKLILLAVFIFLTNPLSTSVIARAAHKDGAVLENDTFKEISP